MNSETNYQPVIFHGDTLVIIIIKIIITAVIRGKGVVCGIRVRSQRGMSGSKDTRATARFCFGCGNELDQTHFQHASMLQRPKCVLCQNELGTDQLLCVKCSRGADQKVGTMLKSSDNDDICCR